MYWLAQRGLTLWAEESWRINDKGFDCRGSDDGRFFFSEEVGEIRNDIAATRTYLKSQLARLDELEKIALAVYPEHIATKIRANIQVSAKEAQELKKRRKE